MDLTPLPTLVLVIAPRGICMYTHSMYIVEEGVRSAFVEKRRQSSVACKWRVALTARPGRHPLRREEHDVCKL